MSKLGTLPELIAEALKGTVALPVIPVIVRKRGQTLNDLEAKLGALGLCAYVMPVLPKAPVAGADFVFFQKGEVRIRVIENRKLNTHRVDAYDAAEAVCKVLQAFNPGGLLEEPGLELFDFELHEDSSGVSLDCIFHAAFQI